MIGKRDCCEKRGLSPFVVPFCCEIFCAEADYRYYLEKLKLACDQQGCQIHAYILLTNHVHLLITPETEQGIAKSLQMLGRYYVQYFNYSYRRTGALWEGRYESTLIDSETYLLTCMRYIELNPVRAAMVSHPGEYPWSSYACNATGAADNLVTPHFVYRRLGKTGQERQAAYRQLFKHHIAESGLTEIRDATNKAWVLGSDRFKRRVQRQLARRIGPSPRGGDRKSEQFKINRG